MKTTKLLALACAISTTSLSAQSTLVTEMAGYFDFESDFLNQADDGGSTYTGPFLDGTANNGAVAGITGGRSGNAMQLSTDTNQHMNVAIGYGEETDLGTSFTISAWYHINTPPTGNATNRYFIFEGSENFDISYGIRDLGAGNAGINDGQAFTQGGSLNIPDAALDGWQHVLQTYTPVAGQVEIETYVNGTSVGTLMIASGDLLGTGVNFGAARNSETNRGFDGLIDEVAIWKRVLTTEEIVSVYALGLNSSPLVSSDPVATPPTIVSFGFDPASVDPGSSSTLSWEVTGATSVTITGGIGAVDLTGSQDITINGETTLTLVAINGNSVQTAETTVEIIIPEANILDGLVAYYDGEDNENDPAASDPDSLTNVGVEVGVAGGVSGNAFQFDNTPDDTLTANTSYSSTLESDLGDSFTISAWYNLDTDAPTGNSGNRHFVWENVSDFDFSYWIDNDGGPGTPTGVQAMFVDDATTNFGSYTKGTWQHVVQTIISFDGTSTVSTYVDGTLVGSDTMPTSTAGNISPIPGLEDTGINFGRARTPASDRPFDGLIDEIGIWSRALTEEEIGILFTLGSNGERITGATETLAITAISYDSLSGDTTIQFVSASGATYAVDQSTDLFVWDEIEDNLVASESLTSYTHNSGQTKSFYRVRRID